MNPTVKKALIIFNALLGIYLIGFTLYFMKNRYEHNSFLKSLDNVREICQKEFPQDFSKYSACLSQRSKESSDSTARPIVSVPPADLNRKYVAVIVEGKSVSKPQVIEGNIEGEVVKINLIKALEKFYSSKDMEKLETRGLYNYAGNYNFGEVKVVVNNSSSIDLLIRPYSEVGFLAFNLGSVKLIIQTDDLSSSELLENLN